MPNNVVKKIPERKCMGCNEKRPKKDLVRVVRTPDGTVQLDVTGKMSGRGAYICPKTSCYEKALKTKRLERCLEIQIPDEIYGMVKEKLKGDDDDKNP